MFIWLVDYWVYNTDIWLFYKTEAATRGVLR